ncbi:MAG: hypothetical protein HY544_05405 [Candidatus Diapherotrites archaeon]|uniref:Uncharacterized protein n=1 Tax=Candidatus Iainarchaeum sp. TaxID=3101447 RepID=A0A8T3YPH4_9ARCH|nr:hypothetical protein [Candidatus Diapherotrites archaeon]
MTKIAFEHRKAEIRGALDRSRIKGERNSLLVRLGKQAAKLQRDNELRPIATCFISLLGRNESLMIHTTAVDELLRLAEANKLPEDMKHQIIEHIVRDTAQRNPTFSRLKTARRLADSLGVEKRQIGYRAAGLVHQFHGFERVRARPLGKGRTQISVTFKRHV